MHGIKQSGEGVELLRCPCGLARVFLQSVIGDRLLGRLKIALLLVIIEDACRGIEIVRIAGQRRVRLVKEPAQAARLTHQIKIVLDQLRRPQGLEVLLVNCQPLFHGALLVRQQRSRFRGKDLIVRKFGVVLRDQVSCGLEIFFIQQKFKIAAVEPWLLRVSRDPGIVLLDGGVPAQRLRLNHLERPLKSLPRALVRDRGESF